MLLNNLAKAYAESGQYEQAEEMAREAVRIAEKTQNTHLSQFMANLGVILHSEGILLFQVAFLLLASQQPTRGKCSWLSN